MHLTPLVRALERTHARPTTTNTQKHSLVPLEQRDQFFTAIDAAVDEIRFGVQCAAVQQARNAGETAVNSALHAHYDALVHERTPSLRNLADTALRKSLQTDGFHAGENAVARFAAEIERLQTIAAPHPSTGLPTLFHEARKTLSAVAQPGSVWRRLAPFTVYQPPVELRTHVVNDTAGALGLCARAAVAKGTDTAHTFIDLLRDLTRMAVNEHVTRLAREIDATPENELSAPRRQEFMRSCAEIRARAGDYGNRVADQALHLVTDHAQLDRELLNPEWFPAFRILDILSEFSENGDAAQLLHARLPFLDNFLAGPVRVAIKAEPAELETTPYHRELLDRMRDTDAIAGMVLNCASRAIHSVQATPPAVSESAQLLDQLETSLTYFDYARVNERALLQVMATERAPRALG